MNPLQNLRLHVLPALAAAALLLPALGHAHDAWVDPGPKGYAVVFGHENEHTDFDPAKVKAITALDAQGRPLPVQQQPADKAVRVSAQGQPALWVLHFDNGFWSRAPGSAESKNLPRNEVPGATSGSHAVKFGKTVVAWSPVVGRPQNHRLEIVPLATTQPAAGQSLPVQVLWEGRPLAGARLVRAGAPKGTPPIEADTDGKAQVPVVAGLQMLSVARRVDRLDDPRANIDSVAANLVFSAP